MATREAGQLGQGDEDQLACAVQPQWAFFTHNRADVEVLARLSRSTEAAAARLTLSVVGRYNNAIPPYESVVHLFWAVHQREW